MFKPKSRKITENCYFWAENPKYQIAKSPKTCLDHSRLWPTENQTTKLKFLFTSKLADSNFTAYNVHLWTLYEGNIKPGHTLAKIFREWVFWVAEMSEKVIFPEVYFSREWSAYPGNGPISSDSVKSSCPPPTTSSTKYAKTKNI